MVRNFGCFQTPRCLESDPRVLRKPDTCRARRARPAEAPPAGGRPAALRDRARGRNPRAPCLPASGRAARRPPGCPKSPWDIQGQLWSDLSDGRQWFCRNLIIQGLPRPCFVRFSNQDGSRISFPRFLIHRCCFAANPGPGYSAGGRPGTVPKGGRRRRRNALRHKCRAAGSVAAAARAPLSAAPPN